MIRRLALSAWLLSSIAVTQPVTTATGTGLSPVTGALTTSAGVKFICVSKQVTNGGGAPFKLTMPVDLAESDGLVAKGFGLDFCTDSARDIDSFKRSMCTLAEGNEAVQNRTREVLGVDGTTLCSIARTLLSDTSAQPHGVPDHPPSKPK